MDSNNPSARPSDNSDGENPADVSATSSGAVPETKPFDLGVIKDGVTDIPIVYQYAQRIGATLRGMRKLVVRERHGAYFADIAEVRFTNDGEVIAPAGFEPTNAEAAAIREAWPRYKWPEYSPWPCSSRGLRHDSARFPFQRTDEQKLAVFWDQNRECILMVEERLVTKNGGKPWQSLKPVTVREMATSSLACHLPHNFRQAAANDPELVWNPLARKYRLRQPGDTCPA